MEELPLELLEYIFKFLTFWERVIPRRVCKIFDQVGRRLGPLPIFSSSDYSISLQEASMVYYIINLHEMDGYLYEWQKSHIIHSEVRLVKGDFFLTREKKMYEYNGHISLFIQEEVADFDFTYSKEKTNQLIVLNNGTMICNQKKWKHPREVKQVVFVEPEERIYLTKQGKIYRATKRKNPVLNKKAQIAAKLLFSGIGINKQGDAIINSRLLKMELLAWETCSTNNSSIFLYRDGRIDIHIKNSFAVEISNNGIWIAADYYNRFYYVNTKLELYVVDVHDDSSFDIIFLEGGVLKFFVTNKRNYILKIN